MTRTTLTLCVVVCLLCMTSAVPTTQSTDNVTEAGSGLRVRVTARQVSHVTLEWDEPDEEVLGYQIKGQKDDSADIILSPPLSSASTEYSMENLMTDASYTICVRAATNDAKQPANTNSDLTYNLEECVKTKTIPTIRQDSLIAVCAAIGYIVLMIIVGYLCWFCAKRRIERSMEEEEEEEEQPEEKLVPASYRPAYVSPTSGQPVRSSIEDPDIPYITPPVDQLSKPEKEAYHSKV